MRRALLLPALALLFGAAVHAEMGKTWTTSGSEQFADGKLDGVSVLSTGEAELAPETERIEGLEAEFVWDVENDGTTVYVATGGPAAVYVLREGRAEVLLKVEAKHVLSVLPLPDGSVLAAKAPGGEILRIDRHGKAETFAKLDDEYVWDMALGPRREIYCATGPNGRLIKAKRTGEVTELLKVKQKNLMCVAFAPDGTAYAGTDTDGYIYRISPDGEATVLYDAEESEVHAIAVDGDGTVYACTAQGERPEPSEGNSSDGGGPPSPPTGPPLPSRQGGGRPGPRNSVYRVHARRGGFPIGRFEGTLLLSMAISDDDVLVGTGTQGRLLGISPDLRYRIVTDFEAAHLTALTALPDGSVFLGASNPGGLWRLSKGVRKSGVLTSKPFDTGYLSRWGRVRWKEQVGVGQRVRLRVRTGNSGEPDEHWAPWSDWAVDATGATLDVPMGRFVQFSAELTTRGNAGTPSLLEVSVSYRQANQKPVIADVLVNGESVLGGTRATGPQPGARRPTRPQGGQPPGGGRATPGVAVIAWKAADPNEDELAFDLYYRGEGETDWKELETDLRGEPIYRWDTARVPDGHYLLKLVARDDIVRPPDEALAEEKVTPPVLVDNRPPAILELAGRRLADGSYELTGLAADECGRIAGIQLSRNSGDWAPVFPDDGIFDSRQEPFAHRTEVLEPGEHVFVFAAGDENDNVGSAKIVLVVPAPGE